MCLYLPPNLFVTLLNPSNVHRRIDILDVVADVGDRPADVALDDLVLQIRLQIDQEVPDN